MRIKGVEPEEHPHCPPNTPAASARAHNVLRSCPQARAPTRQARSTRSIGAASRLFGFPRLPVPRRSTHEWPAPTPPPGYRTCRGPCWLAFHSTGTSRRPLLALLYACSRRAGNRNSRETAAKRWCQTAENAVCVVYTNCASRWRATVRNDGNLVPSPSRLVKPSGRAAPEPALLGRFVLLEAPLAQLARASCL